MKAKIAPMSPIKSPGTLPKSSCLANNKAIANPIAAQTISNTVFKALKVHFFGSPKTSNTLLNELILASLEPEAHQNSGFLVYFFALQQINFLGKFLIKVYRFFYILGLNCPCGKRG
jgi:hypothetical protein